MAAKKDSSKFEGEGICYRAKLIGIEDVPEARGDQMCQDSLLRLKGDVKSSGEHKQKIIVNVSLEGLKIVDPIARTILHTHAVHRISFIARDTTDSRAFGYIVGEEDGGYKFFAIKTAGAAEQLVFSIRDLFQAVYDMKKQEMEEAKEKLEKGEVTTPEEENSQASRNGSTSGTTQTPQSTVNADGEGIYQVPPNNAPVRKESQAEQAANLLNLEDQAETILKGIEQIKNLEFESLPQDTMGSPASTPTSPFAQLAPPPTASNADPWGVPAATPAAAPVPNSGSNQNDLAGLSAAFSPMQQPAFGVPVMGGLPVTKDPFANDPFSVNANVQIRPQGQMGFPPQNPYGGNAFIAPQPGVPAMGVMPGAMPPGVLPPGTMPLGAIPPGIRPPGGMAPGMVPQGFPGQIAGGVVNPFGVQQPAQMTNAFAQEPPNLLQPTKPDGEPTAEEPTPTKARAGSARNDLFGDLVELKKSAPATAQNPKEMFEQVNSVEKKSMNDMKKDSVQASAFGDPF